jgi:hypothetical protein
LRPAKQNGTTLAETRAARAGIATSAEFLHIPSLHAAWTQFIKIMASETIMKLRSVILSFGLLACCGLAHAQVDLSELSRGMAGPRTEVLVLGTAHLSTAPKSFNPESLQPLLARLAAFKPDIVAVESISGEECALIKQYPSIYDPENIGPFCIDTGDAKAATELDQSAAVAAVHAAMKAWPAHPTPVQRRHLVALFLAAGEPASALVQWLQLPETERHAGDGLNDALVAQMNKRLGYHNEVDLLAAPLAAKLGEQRVYPIDDHTGDNVTIPKSGDEAFAAAIRKAWGSSRARIQPRRDQEHDLLANNHIMALYRLLNQPASQQAAIEADMGAALGDGVAPYYGHMYVTGWETRNLRMASSIMATFRERPGARVLVIVGATHKPWLDKILDQMPNVRVVDAEKVLGAGD